MFASYIKNLLDQTHYSKDENGVIIATIPEKEEYYTQGDTFEEARENMIDLIETFLIDDIKYADNEELEKMRITKKLTGINKLSYA